jgi:hypothetical protein
MISASMVSTITLTYSGTNPWTVFDSSNLCTGAALQADWNDIASQLNALYKPLLNSAVNEIGILEGASGANYVGVSSITGIVSATTVWSALYGLNSSVSAINASAAYAGSAAYAISASTAQVAAYTASAGTVSGLTIAVSALNNVTAESVQDRGFSSDLAAWYNHNIIPFSDCESADGWAENGWTGIVGTVANDTTNFRTGSQGISITVSLNNDGGGHLSYVKNLALFPDGSASATSDYVRFCLYITTAEINKMAADSVLRFMFFCDTIPTVGDFFYYDITKATLVNGWNFVNIAKSSFTAIASANWANVKGTQVIYNSAGATAPTSAMTWTIDTIHVCRKDPVGVYPNPFQRRINNVETVDFNINSGFWWLGLESGKLNWRDLNPSSDTAGGSTAASLIGLKSYSSTFKAYMRQSIKTANNSSKLVWEIDSSNRIVAAIIAPDLYLYVTTAGVNDWTSAAAYACAVDDVIEFKLERNGTTVSLLVYKNGETIPSGKLTKEVSFTSIGYLSVGNTAAIYANIESLSITTTDHAHHADIAEVARTAVTALAATTALAAVSATYAVSASTAAQATTAVAAVYSTSAAFAVSATTAQGALSAVTAARATTANAASTALAAASASYAASAGTLSGYSSIMTTTGSQVMTNYLKAANLSSYTSPFTRNIIFSTTAVTAGSCASGDAIFIYTA